MPQKHNLTFAHLYLTFGLAMFLFAFPLAYAGVIYYDYALADIFRSLGVAVQLRAFLTLPVAFGVGSIGFYSWRYQARSLGIAEQMPGSRAWILVLYRFLAVAFASIALFAGLAIFGALSLMLFISFGGNYPVTLTKDFLFIFGILVNMILCLVHFAIAFRSIIFHLQLPRNAPFNRVTES